MTIEPSRLIWLATPALVASAVPAPAQVYLNEAQALQAIFGSGVTVHREEKRFAPGERAQLEATTGLRFPETSWTFFVATQQEKVVGYALVLDEIGKSEPITFMVGMSPEGKVSEVVVMVFRESRGSEVREKRFLRQFQGKTAADPIRVQQDILNYTGATLSSRAIARGVKRALLLLEHFYPRETSREPPRSGALIRPASPSPIATAREAALYRQARSLMGTVCELSVWTNSPVSAERAFSAGFAELQRMDRLFSNYRPDSELSFVNREAAARPAPVSNEFWDLTRAAARHARQSRGRFDITAGPLVKLWGFWAHEPRVPTEGELRAARKCVGFENVRLDGRGQTVRFRASGMEFDFGGLAKGYAAERAARVLAKHGARSALVNIGGSSLCALSSPHRKAPALDAAREKFDAREAEWIVAVADPREPTHGAFFFVLEDGWSLSTSGTYEQHFAHDGRTLSHIIDPRTGWPIEGVRSATVLARSGARSEVLSKQLLITPEAERKNLLRKWRSDWLLLEVLPTGILSVHHRMRRSTILLPSA